MASARTVLRIVAQQRGVTVSDLKGPDRRRPLVCWRQEACWLMQRHTGLSSTSIGIVLGDRDHTTVLSAIAAVNRRAVDDAAYRTELRALEALVVRAPADPAEREPVLTLASRLVGDPDSAVADDADRLATGLLTLASVIRCADLSDGDARTAAGAILSGMEGAAHA